MSLKQRRIESGYTQKSIAAVLGVDQSTVALWETGKTMPRASMLPKIAKLCGCTVDELLSPDPDSSNSTA